MKFSTWLHALLEDTTPDGAVDEVVTYDNSATTSKRVKIVNLIGAAGGIPINGWIGAAAMTYASADDPTYTATMVGDVSGIYQVGQRIKLTQATGGTKYFIITKIAVAGNTTLTLYGGTDYNLENEAISSPCYSPVKAPFGFPLNPDKWTIEITDTGNRSQATPTQNVWYNLGSVTISIPIGIWDVDYRVLLCVADTTSISWTVYSTLSTANNSESDKQLTCLSGVDAIIVLYSTSTARKIIELTSKTSYYLNTKTGSANLDNMYNRGDVATTIIRAVCAYL